MSATVPPWSKKKRVKTALKMSGLIIGVSVALGSSLFLILLLTGLVKPFSLQKAVEQEVLKNPNLVNAFYNQLSSTQCINSTVGYAVLYDHPLRASVGNENNKCTEFTLVNAASSTSYIKIEHNDQKKEHIVNTLVSDLENVESNIFNHPLYEATLIGGYSKNLYINAIVISLSNQSSVSLLLFPADAAGINALKSLAATYKKM